MLVLTVVSINIICNLVRTLRTLKCNKKEEIVNTPQPSGTEAQLLEAEFQQELKSLSERKRRTFLRYLKNQEKSKISFSFYFFKSVFFQNGMNVEFKLRGHL